MNLHKVGVIFIMKIVLHARMHGGGGEHNQKVVL